jgi:hypothetical protein
MTLLVNLYWHLRQHPKTGIISGFSSGFFFKFQALLTDEFLMKMVAGFGTCCSSALAFLTLAIWFSKQIESYLSKRKIPKPNDKISD